MKNFRDKVAVITGSGSGMGRELAIELAQAGANTTLKILISVLETANA